MITYEVNVYADGSKSWWLNGQRHREDGPAYEGANGTKYWYLNGQRHREDGPAIEWEDGDNEWWLNGVRQDVTQGVDNPWAPEAEALAERAYEIADAFIAARETRETDT